MSRISGRYLGTVTVDFEKDVPDDEVSLLKDKISNTIMTDIFNHLHDADVNIRGILIHNEYFKLREDRA